MEQDGMNMLFFLNRAALLGTWAGNALVSLEQSLEIRIGLIWISAGIGWVLRGATAWIRYYTYFRRPLKM